MIKSFFSFAIAVGIFLGAVYCAEAASAKAAIKGTAEGSALSGTVNLVETANGLRIEAAISGAPKGKKGFHIHENGSCDDFGKAAGGHFNPDGHHHGNAVEKGIEKAHAGDLGNIKINRSGKGKLSVFLPGLNLAEGPYNVMGKAVILHEKEDDFGQPAGNAGARIGCGIIEAA